MSPQQPASESLNNAPVEDWFPRVYDELKRMAAAAMAAERPGQTLDATALVHEAYLRLITPNGEAAFANRRHFFTAAAEAMRRILVDRARRKKTVKHGGNRKRLDLIDDPTMCDHSDDLLAVHEGLALLAAEDALAARVVELRYFAGLSHAEIAGALETTVYHVRQKWAYARAWLRDRLNR